MGLEMPIGLDLRWGLRAAHLKEAPKVGTTRAHLRAPTRAIKGGEGGGGAPHLCSPSRPFVGALLPLSVAPPPAHQALVRSCGSSNPESEVSFRMCGLRGGAALAAQE